MTVNLNMLCINAWEENAQQQLEQLRCNRAPQGDVVSEASRQKTAEVFGEPLTPNQVVQRICEDVQNKGVAAVLEYSEKLDHAQLTIETLRVPSEDLAAAHSKADPEFLACVRRIRDHILEFQKTILHRDVYLESEERVLRQRYLPLARVGICVPGGAAAYPSTVLMTAVPAQAAGVGELAIVAPPTPFGAYNSDLLATCHELGICEVYRIGGAQAVAALAYGVEGLPRVDKIVGPGNLFVALAKKTVYGQVDIDSIAGPSEVIVIADESANPEYVAADLIAQAEHAPGSSLLITWNSDLLAATQRALELQLGRLERADLAQQSLEDFGALILVRNAEEGVRLANQLATEHLHIATQDAHALLERIQHAGAVFLGHHSPVALGDYVAGPSHVLPTGGTARFSSGLSANDFLRSHSVIEFTRRGLEHAARDVRIMADKEGLTAHRASVDVRLDRGDSCG